MGTKTTQQAQVSGKGIGLLDTHSFTGGHDTVVNEGYIAGPGQWKAIDFIR